MSNVRDRIAMNQWLSCSNDVIGINALSLSDAFISALLMDFIRHHLYEWITMDDRK